MITSIRSPLSMPSFSSSPLGRTRVSSHKFFAHPTTCRSILAFLAPRRSAQTRQHASPCAIAPPLAARSHSRGTFAARSHSRGTFAAQIPIAEPAARPTERTSRDFVPWRFSDAGRRSAWLDRRCRRPKTCTKGAVRYPARALSQFRSTPISRPNGPALRGLLSAKPDSCIAARRVLFDHLVGATKQRKREGDAERLSGLEVDRQLDRGRLLDRYIAGLGPSQNLDELAGQLTE
jgi:hypothetical protein